MVFLVVTAWVSNEAKVWILVAPLAILGAALTVFAVLALRPARVSVRSLVILGALELGVVIFLLAASRPITGGTITGALISLVAAAITFWAAFRARAAARLPAPTVVAGPRKPAPISVTIRKPAGSAAGNRPATGKPTGRSKRKR